MTRSIATRYPPTLVALHWVLALLIIGLLCLGFLVLAALPNSDPRKLDLLVWHMGGGMIVLGLMILRAIVRLRSPRPGPARTCSPRLDRLASFAHRGLYLIVFLLIATGWSTGWLIRGAFEPGRSLPHTFTAFPTFQAHAFLATALCIVIAGHVAAALYHQFALKDGIFRRIWFGNRRIAAGSLGNPTKHS